MREHGQRRVRAHRADGLRAVQGHRQDRIPVFLIGIAEGALQTRALGAGQRGDLLVGHLHIAQAQKVLVQPFAVRALRGVALAHGVVVQQFAFGQIGQQHLARVQAAFAQDPALVQLQHAGLGRQDQPPIVGHAVARRAQAVAVQRRAQHVAVAEQKGRRAVPRFHHGGVVLVKIPPLAAQSIVVRPGFGQRHGHGQRQLHAAHHQKFQRVIQHGGVGPFAVHDRQHAGQIAAKGFGVHRLFPREHLVDVAADGVDLAVVGDEPVGVGALPARLGVGGKARMHNGQRRFIFRRAQIVKKGAQLPDQEHPLVHDGPAGQRADIAGGAALLKHAAHHIQPPVKRQARGHPGGLLHKTLPDGRHAGARLAAQHIGGDGHFAPAKEAEALFLHNDLEHLHGLAALQLPLREKEHAHAVLPLAGQFDAKGFAGFGKIAVRDLGQDADAVAGLALGVLTGAVLKVFHNGQRVGHDLVAFAAAEIGHGADAAVVVLPRGAVQGAGCFHGMFPLLP